MMRHHRFQAVAGRFGIVKITSLVGLQTHGKLVEVLGHLVIRVQALVPVGLAIAVEIVEHSQLVPTGNINPAVHHFQPQRLEHAGGNALPAQFVAHRLHHPHIPIPRAEGHAAIWKEIQTREAGLRQPGVGLGRAEQIHSEGPIIVPLHHHGFQFLGPA